MRLIVEVKEETADIFGLYIKSFHRIWTGDLKCNYLFLIIKTNRRFFTNAKKVKVIMSVFRPGLFRDKVAIVTGKF